MSDPTGSGADAGDPACWLDEVCDRCGDVREEGHDCASADRAGDRSLLGRLPDGLELARTTDVFDQESVPAGLRRAHRVATGVWGRLVVHEGSIGFRFEDDDQPLRANAGEWIVIPPDRPHHVELIGPVRFAVEFHRPSDSLGSIPG